LLSTGEIALLGLGALALVLVGAGLRRLGPASEVRR
jgi:hypothetical protein